MVNELAQKCRSAVWAPQTRRSTPIALIEAAERGRPTIITRHGRPAAAIVPVEDSRRLYPDVRSSVVALLSSFPDGVEFERNRTPLGEVDF